MRLFATSKTAVWRNNAVSFGETKSCEPSSKHDVKIACVCVCVPTAGDTEGKHVVLTGSKVATLNLADFVLAPILFIPG